MKSTHCLIHCLRRVSLLALLALALSWTPGPALTATRSRTEGEPPGAGLVRPASYRIGLARQFEETSYYFKDVDMVTTEVGWAVGAPHWDQSAKAYTGTIVKTIDGGQTWTAQAAGASETLRGVDFVDSNHGWAVGVNGTILRTTDGGAHWARQTVATSDEFRGLVFVDRNRGWATSVRPTHYDTYGDPDNWQAGIWHTSNGGQSWGRQPLPSGASILNRIDFVDARQGWAVGVRYIGDDTFGQPQHRAVIYGTSDGGGTWVEQYAPDLEVSLTGVDFWDADHGWAVGFPTRSSVTGGFVFHTADGGATWERQEPGSLYATLWDVHFVDPNRGYAVGFDYVGAWGPPVWRTMDGGASWTKVRMAQHDNDGLFGLSIAGDQVVAVGDHDFVARSTRAWDSCAWTAPEPPCYDCDCLFEQFYVNVHYRFEDVFFVDSTHGWAVGRRTYQPELWGQVILNTADGGATWQTQYEHAPPDALFSVHRLAQVHFVDSQNGWAVGRSESYRDASGWVYEGAILHTTDGGQHWEQQGAELYEGRKREFFAVQALDGQNVWALAESHFPDRNIFAGRTLNGGTDWNWVDTGITGTLGIGFELVQGDLAFTDAQHGWVIGGLGQIAHTADGGSSWVRQELTCGWTTCPIRLYALAFTNHQEGWIAGEGLYHTTDGGAHWNEHELQVNVDFQDIEFVDAQNGWLAGERGLVMRTTDGGANWVWVENDVSGFTLRGASFVAPEQGWFVGDGGVILTTIEVPYWPLYLPMIVVDR